MLETAESYASQLTACLEKEKDGIFAVQLIGLQVIPNKSNYRNMMLISRYCYNNSDISYQRLLKKLFFIVPHKWEVAGNLKTTKVTPGI